MYKQVRKKRRVRRAVQEANRRALMKVWTAGLAVTIVGCFVIILTISAVDRAMHSWPAPVNPLIPK